MAKDPAFLFYPGDWILGTLGMSLREKGAYIELLMMQFNRGLFTDEMAHTCVRDEKLWDSIKFKFEHKDGLYWNDRLLEEKEKRKAYTESRRKSRLKSDEDNVRIYIVRDNVRSTYKIGSSVNPVRRYNELNNQKKPAIMGDSDPNDRDITLLWYSDPVLRSEETALHNTFSDKNISGEWFSLTKKDLEYIFNKYKGTFKERTSERTEDVNENEDVNVIKKGKCLMRNSSLTIPEVKEAFQKADDLKAADPKYYFNAAMDWSDAGNNMRTDWVATIRSFARRDSKDGKLKLSIYQTKTGTNMGDRYKPEPLPETWDAMPDSLKKHMKNIGK